MKASVSACCFLSLALLAACAPQAELVRTQDSLNEVRAEVRAVKAQIPDVSGLTKRQDLLESNLKSTTEIQKSVADQGVRFDQLMTDLQILQGKLEENNFRVKELAQKLDDKTFRIAELTSRFEQLENKVKSLPTGTVAEASAPEKEKKPEPKAPEPSVAYKQAKDDYDKTNFDLAIAGFQNYLKLFPDSSQADSAQYWIGECYYSKKEYEKSIEEFTRLLKNHPQSDKAPGARLKIGYSYLNEKNNAKAKENLQKVVKDYPTSREAELAKEKLKKIGK